MLMTQLKPMGEIQAISCMGAAIISCDGCNEVYFPEAEAEGAYGALLRSGAASGIARGSYICDPENLGLFLKYHSGLFDNASAVLVFSCGVGAQVVAEMLAGAPVFVCCDTFPLPGHQGVTPTEHDCLQCGECHLNSTGGICPIASCAKSLVNGQCGGSKKGRCEVDRDMECGWERINLRLSRLGLLPSGPAKLRDFALLGQRRCGAIGDGAIGGDAIGGGANSDGANSGGAIGDSAIGDGAIGDGAIGGGANSDGANSDDADSKSGGGWYEDH